ncbi:MAG: glycosyl hydrolase, partial [Pseudonocardiales bacterium]
MTTTWEDDGTWRGTEVVWALEDGSLNGFAGKLSVAIPMLSNRSDTLSACAAGAYDSHFVALGNTLKRHNRADAFVRLGWEGNGDWYAWSAGSDPATWIACFRREVTALRSADPLAHIDWNMNKDGRIGAQLMYPGDAYVDVVGVDFYDMYPVYRTQTDWDTDYMRTQNGGPRGLGAWLAFAKSHGKRLSVPEWGVNNGGGDGGFDNPFYIQAMHDFFAANAGSIAYESYFNSQCPAFCISPAGINPLASSTYKRLWLAGATPSPSPSGSPSP